MYCFSIFIAQALGGPRALAGTRGARLRKSTKEKKNTGCWPASASLCSSLFHHCWKTCHCGRNLALAQGKRGQERRGQLSRWTKSLRRAFLNGSIPTSGPLRVGFWFGLAFCGYSDFLPQCQDVHSRDWQRIWNLHWNVNLCDFLYFIFSLLSQCLYSCSKLCCCMFAVLILHMQSFRVRRILYSPLL